MTRTEKINAIAERLGTWPGANVDETIDKIKRVAANMGINVDAEIEAAVDD